MREEKFKVIQYIREFIVSNDKNLDSFPKEYIEIKNRIRKNSFDLLELAYEANSISIVEKKIDIIYKIIAKLKVIDFLLNLSLDKKLITAKKYYKSGEKLGDIAKFANGWLKRLGATVSEV